MANLKMLNYLSVKLGDIISIPVAPDDRVYDGKVIYINEERGFCRLEFFTESGYRFTESFRMYNLPWESELKECV